MIRPGTFRAKVTNYGVTVSDKTGDPSIYIEFSWDEGGTANKWNWTGAYTTEKSIERVHKTLLTLGMTSNDLDLLAGGMSSECLDTVTEYEIVVKEDTWNDKPRTQIAFVNRVGDRNASFGKTMTQAQAKSIFASKNAKAAMAAARAGSGAGTVVKSTTAKTTEAAIEEIPF